MTQVRENRPHVPVMLREVLEALSPRDGEVYIDATFGAGGYSRAILDHADCTVYGFDRDPRAISAAANLVEAYEGRLVLVEAPFAEIQQKLEELGVEQVDGVVFDLGVSSMQLDEAERGFSFRFEGPLSMRMDGGHPDAADVVNAADEQDLKTIFRVFGEEKRASSLARAILRVRKANPITTTKALANIIEAASPSRHVGKGRAIHPATRVFQALRIFVNDELGQLARALVATENMLRVGGRLVAVSFHSLEARIVKRFFQDRTGQGETFSRHQPMARVQASTFENLFRGQKAPSAEEQQENPRARSAALRAGIRTHEDPRKDDLAFAGLPVLNLSKSLTQMEDLLC